MRKEEDMVDQQLLTAEGGRGADSTEETKETVKEGDRLPDQPTRGLRPVSGATLLDTTDPSVRWGCSPSGFSIAPRTPL
jgi:hypothetical protein